jgi:hypothetical protein
MAHKAMEMMASAEIRIAERDYRGAFSLGTFLGCGIFGAFSVWFPNALPIFVFFGGQETQKQGSWKF